MHPAGQAQKQLRCRGEMCVGWGAESRMHSQLVHAKRTRRACRERHRNVSAYYKQARAWKKQFFRPPPASPSGVPCSAHWAASASAARAACRCCRLRRALSRRYSFRLERSFFSFVLSLLLCCFWARVRPRTGELLRRVPPVEEFSAIAVLTQVHCRLGWQICVGACIASSRSL